FKTEIKRLNIEDKFLKDSIITEGKIDFDKSHAQKTPCPDYLLQYPKKNPRIEITFEKCNDKVTLQTIKALR
ncbi:MAG: hypothetical protein Q4C75_06205, partial [Bergeyella zoohelcum]|nr:hypothetical protein [Bergeyella zoohelcum]